MLSGRVYGFVCWGRDERFMGVFLTMELGNKGKNGVVLWSLYNDFSWLSWSDTAPTICNAIIFNFGKDEEAPLDARNAGRGLRLNNHVVWRQWR